MLNVTEKEQLRHDETSFFKSSRVTCQSPVAHVVISFLAGVLLSSSYFVGFHFTDPNILWNEIGLDPDFESKNNFSSEPSSTSSIQLQQQHSSFNRIREKICWRSNEQESSWRGVVISGSGCESCLAGSPCSFTISILPPASWYMEEAYASGIPFKQDLMVTFVGKSLAHGHISETFPFPPGRRIGTHLTVTYTIWDPGEYKGRVMAVCGNLNYTAKFREMGSHVIGEWTTTVRSALHRGVPVSSSPLPCALGHHARWVRQYKRQINRFKYRWIAFNCSSEPLIAEFPSEMNARGVTAVFFIGDSHLRLLLQHILFLVSGISDSSHHKWQKRFSHTLTDSRNGSLELTFIWGAAPFVNHPPPASRNGSLELTFIWGAAPFVNHPHCSRDALWNATDLGFPRLAQLPASSIAVMDGGHWTLAFCKENEQAFPELIPGFLRWASKLKAKETVFVSGPPFAGRVGKGDYPSCDGRTNLNIQFTNELALGLLDRYGFRFFDSWEVLAPRHRDVCEVHGTHYTCIDNRNRLYGDVGSAFASSFIYFLEHELISNSRP